MTGMSDRPKILYVIVDSRLWELFKQLWEFRR